MSAAQLDATGLPKKVCGLLIDFGGVVADVRMALSSDAGSEPYVADYNVEVVERLVLLRKTGARVALLTNNDRSYFQRVFAKPVLKEAFDELVFSSDVNAAKPDGRMYLAGLAATGTSPEETLFLDDLAANVDGAGRVGIIGILIDRPDTAVALLDHLLSATENGQ